jgi:hypothetical protein
LHELRVAEARRKRFQEANEAATVGAQRRILASSLGVRAYNPALTMHPSLAFAGSANSIFPLRDLVQASPQAQRVGGKPSSSFLQQSLNGGSGIAGVFGGSSVLSPDIDSIQRRQATINAARESLESEIERLREQDRLLSLAMVRNNISNLPPSYSSAVYHDDQPNDAGGIIVEQRGRYETAMALLSRQQAAPPREVSTGVLGQEGHESSSYYYRYEEDDDASNPP